jgi:hypothetical protein
MQKEESMKIIAPRMEAARRRGLLLMRFKAWAARVERGTLSMRESLGGTRTRAVWDDPQRPGARIALTVTEHPSAVAAMNALADDLVANQLATLPPGPPDVGEVSFAHPPGAPPAVFFARANLTVWVTSFGIVPVEVDDVARTVDLDLTATPAGRPGTLSDIGRVAGDAYVKVLAPGAELVKSDGGIVVREGEMGQVQVFVVD